MKKIAWYRVVDSKTRHVFYSWNSDYDWCLARATFIRESLVNQEAAKRIIIETEEK